MRLSVRCDWEGDEAPKRLHHFFRFPKLSYYVSCAIDEWFDPHLVGVSKAGGGGQLFFSGDGLR